MEPQGWIELAEKNRDDNQGTYAQAYALIAIAKLLEQLVAVQKAEGGYVEIQIPERPEFHEPRSHDTDDIPY